MSNQEICFMTAVEMLDCLRSGNLSARQIMSAHLDQIEQANPQVNAIITLLPEQAMKQATAADEDISQRKEIGSLHGLPMAHKDLILTQNILQQSIIEVLHLPNLVILMTRLNIIIKQ